MAKEFVCYSCEQGYSEEPFARINSKSADSTGKVTKSKREYCGACYHGEFAVMLGQLMNATITIANKIKDQNAVEVDVAALLRKPA